MSQVLHSCRQFVPWGIWLSPRNERNPYEGRKPKRKETGRRPQTMRKSVDEVKSVWPKWHGQSVCYKGNGQRERKMRIRLDRRKHPEVQIVRWKTYMKEEPVVIENQNVSVKENLNIGLTARQRRREGWFWSEVQVIGGPVMNETHEGWTFDSF